MFLNEEIQTMCLNEGVTPEEFLEAYEELCEDAETAKKVVNNKHLAADIASGIVPFTNTVQAIRANDFMTDEGNTNELYKKYIAKCKDNGAKPMSKEQFSRKLKDYYERRRNSKGVAIGGDILFGSLGKPVGAVASHVYANKAFK